MDISPFDLHQDAVRSVVFSPDGTLLASGSSDNTVMLWDIQTGEVQQTLTMPNTIVGLAFSPDGKLLATSGASTGNITIWDLESGEIIETLSGHTDTVVRVSFDKSGTFLAGAGADGLVTIWNTATWEQRYSIEAHNFVWDVEFVGNGRQIVTSGFDGFVKLWNLNTLQVINEVEISEGLRLYGIDVSPVDGRIAISAGDARVYLWNTETDQLVALDGRSRDAVLDVAFSPNGELLASGGRGGQLIFWDVLEAEELAKFDYRTLFSQPSDTSVIDSVIFSLDGAVIVTSNRDGTVRLFGLVE